MLPPYSLPWYCEDTGWFGHVCSRAHPLQERNGGLLPEVLAFEAFAAEHGTTGGWHQDDYEAFERVLKACKGDYSLTVLECCDHLPTKNRSEVIAHAR